MQVNMNHNKVIDEYAEKIISDLTIEEYNEISFVMGARLNELEERLENYK